MSSLGSRVPLWLAAGGELLSHYGSSYCCFLFVPDLVAQRGEKLELLIDKTENLVDSVSSGSWGKGAIDLMYQGAAEARLGVLSFPPCPEKKVRRESVIAPGGGDGREVPEHILSAEKVR